MSEYDPEIDPCSSKFNPQKALAAKNPPMTPNPKVFDNIQMLRAAANRIDNQFETKLLSDNIFVRREKPVVDPDAVERRFLPHQQLVEKKSSAKFSKNLLKRIEAGYEGPLGTLKKYMDDRVRVRIYVRKEHGVRGTVTGFLEAFDKHWNVAVTEVEEIWRRRKKCVSASNVAFANTVDAEVALTKLRKMGIVLPKMEIKSLDRKYVELRRKVGQLLIRGEQIVSIVRVDEQITSKKEHLGS
ncbi:U7 snRNA-associated Sm-like protein LSm11 [Culicoides brevitarsis]|uniref:U7 snRNA-associated Sm-like protein LSm11 n=1 Tax=Culicoides brevitarsis TaxID=469753 RepID=UPI00307B1A25